MKADLLAEVSSIEFYLHPSIAGDQKLWRQASDHLTAGGLLLIRNAFQVPFAERAFECLDHYSDWKLYEGFEDHFHYRHHNIYDEKLFPEALIRCREIFDSDATKSFAQRLAQRDCSGPVTLGASFYQPGDHSLPHNDFTIHAGQQRQVAFIWNLTKDWQADWGGEFFWCKKGQPVTPAFNSLLLFNVARTSMHFVTMVAPHAKGKRFAISGWWTRKGIEVRDAELTRARNKRNDLVECI